MRANYSMKNQNPNYGEFLSTMSTSTTNIKNQKIKMKNYFPPPYRIQKSLKRFPTSIVPPIQILIEFVD